MDSTMMTVCNSPYKSNEMSFYDNSPDSCPKTCSISPYSGMTLEDENNPSYFIITKNAGIKRNKSDGLIRDFNTLDISHYGTTSYSGRHSESSELSGTTLNRIKKDSPKADIMTPRRCFRPLDSICDSLKSSNDDCELLDMESIEDHYTLLPANIDSLITGRLKPKNGEKENKGSQQKSVSMFDSNLNIMNALDKDDFGLIGDFSKSLCLPLITGKHSDLKSISADTMAKLLHGDFLKTVASYCIIDCRYPYEYNGGHIQGAKNIYTHDEIIRFFLNNKTERSTVALDEPKRNIIIFHCEFSSERAPKLLRFLRNKDRELNTYPTLHYPEIYLLHGGYKEFFTRYSDLCDPKNYLPMLATSHTTEYRYFRDTSKTWNGDRVAATSKLRKSRSRLFL